MARDQRRPRTRPGGGPITAAMLVRALLSVLLLPAVMTILVPAWLLPQDRLRDLREAMTSVGGLAVLAAGIGLVLLGVVVVGWTIGDFARLGRGTLAPWDPPRRLVVAGLHRYLRNPMIGGVIVILIGEGLAFRSLPLLGWAALFALSNAAYIRLIEEPGLRRRFGSDYDRYRQNVPRWLPRLRPWDPAAGGEEAGPSGRRGR